MSRKDVKTLRQWPEEWSKRFRPPPRRATSRQRGSSTRRGRRKDTTAKKRSEPRFYPFAPPGKPKKESFFTNVDVAEVVCMIPLIIFFLICAAAFVVTWGAMLIGFPLMLISEALK